MAKIAVIGAGYVGLVTGVCFAQNDNLVVLVERDKEKVKSLIAGKVFFYEPGLDELLMKAIKEKKIIFVDTVKEALNQNIQMVFSCVGTPSLPSGDANLSSVWEVANEVGKNLNNYCLFVN